MGFLGLQPHYHGCSSQCFGFYQWVHLQDHELCLGVLPPKLEKHFLEIRMHQDSGTSMTTMCINAEIFGYTAKFTFKSLVKPKTIISLESIAHTFLYGLVVFKPS